ncbi:MAG: cyanophycin synthetase, partial [Candidatus Eisenbacteria bacterium]
GAKARAAVIHADDAHAARVADAAERTGFRVLRYGTRNERGGSAGKLDVGVEAVEPRPDGLAVRFRFEAPAHLAGWPRSREGAESVNDELQFHLPLLGRYNALNAAAACAAATALGLPLHVIRRGLEAIPGVPGRLEPVAAGRPFMVAVDYAHTPDALERALAAVQEHARGRVLLVFGCGGDRDRGKRPVMGATAARGAAAIWVTNDNPRSEDPRTIAGEIMAGAATAGGSVPIVELDRRAAIAAAIAAARPGDVVLIAGKGHETTQTIGDRVEPFDDRQVARELLHGGGGA